MCAAVVEAISFRDSDSGSGYLVTLDSTDGGLQTFTGVNLNVSLSGCHAVVSIKFWPFCLDKSNLTNLLKYL